MKNPLKNPTLSLFFLVTLFICEPALDVVTMPQDEFMMLGKEVHKIVPALLAQPAYCKKPIINKVMKKMLRQLSANAQFEVDSEGVPCPSQRLVTFDFLTWNPDLQQYDIDFDSINQLVGIPLTSSNPIWGRANNLIHLNEDSFPSEGNVLILAAGEEGSKSAKMISQAHPNLNVYASDFRFHDHDESTTLHYRYVDHRTHLPFPDNSIDVMTMRLGLCACGPYLISIKSTCGGIPLCSGSEVPLFFQEILRIMNKNNPKSIIVLHGAELATPIEYSDTYQRILDQLNQHYGNIFSIVVSRPHYANLQLSPILEQSSSTLNSSGFLIIIRLNLSENKEI